MIIQLNDDIHVVLKVQHNFVQFFQNSYSIFNGDYGDSRQPLIIQGSVWAIFICVEMLVASAATCLRTMKFSFLAFLRIWMTTSRDSGSNLLYWILFLIKRPATTKQMEVYLRSRLKQQSRHSLQDLIPQLRKRLQRQNVIFNYQSKLIITKNLYQTHQNMITILFILYSFFGVSLSNKQQVFINIILKQQLPTMSTRLSLAAILNEWTGQEVLLKVQGFKMIVIDAKRSRNKKSDGSIGLFSRLASGYQKNGQQDQYFDRLSNQQYGQYVIKAKSRNKNHRVSLADLGQVYNTSRMAPLPRQKRQYSQNYQQLQQNKQPPIKKSPNILAPSYKTGPTYEKYQTQNSNKQRTPFIQLNSNNNNQLPQSNMRYYTNTNTNNHIRNDIDIGQMEKIKQSINGIKLPNNDNLCPDYASANLRFQGMKTEILRKIIQSGQINDVTDIIKQLMQAADQIIARHLPTEPTLKKHIFSFKDQLQPNLTQILQNQNFVPNINLNPIQELDEKSQCMNLPQFKDDAGSISSILSQNADKKNQSKDQDSCKIQNVFIKDDFDMRNVNDSSGSIRPIVLEQFDQSSPIEIKIIQGVKMEQQAQQAAEPECSLRVKNTIAQSKFTNFVPEQPKIEVPKTKGAQALQSMNTFLKKQRPYHHQTQPYPQCYQLQKLTQQPVKIIQNLQQAQKYDPEVVKFTQLKAKYIQTRTITPQIIRIASPLRFRRKQEVVKHLVANQIVQRESNSIQFVNQ